MKTEEHPRILACDPGKVNFAWVFRSNGEVSDSGWVTPLKNINEDSEFVNDFIELIVKTNPDYVILERFMVRNRGQSVLAEIINQMLGRIAMITALYTATPLIQVTAAQWKNWWNKTKKEDWEKVFSSLDSVHKRDAAGIAQYAEEYWLAKNLQR